MIVTGHPPLRVNPDPQTLAQIKIAALAQLANSGLVKAGEIERLVAGSCDAVLDRIFQFCGCVRVHCGDGQILEIYPGDTLQ